MATSDVRSDVPGTSERKQSKEKLPLYGNHTANIDKNTKKTENTSVSHDEHIFSRYNNTENAKKPVMKDTEIVMEKGEKNRSHLEFKSQKASRTHDTISNKTVFRNNLESKLRNGSQRHNTTPGNVNKPNDISLGEYFNAEEQRREKYKKEMSSQDISSRVNNVIRKHGKDVDGFDKSENKGRIFENGKHGKDVDGFDNSGNKGRIFENGKHGKDVDGFDKSENKGRIFENGKHGKDKGGFDNSEGEGRIFENGKHGEDKGTFDNSEGEGRIFEYDTTTDGENEPDLSSKGDSTTDFDERTAKNNNIVMLADDSGEKTQETEGFGVNNGEESSFESEQGETKELIGNEDFNVEEGRQTTINDVPKIKDWYGSTGIPEAYGDNREYGEDNEGYLDPSVSTGLEKRDLTTLEKLQNEGDLTRQDPIRELFNDLDDPLMSDFLSNTLKMAVNDEGGIKIPSDVDYNNKKATTVDERQRKEPRDENGAEDRDEMPANATNVNDSEEDANKDNMIQREEDITTRLSDMSSNELDSLSVNGIATKAGVVPDNDGGGRVSFGPLSQQRARTSPLPTTDEPPFMGNKVVHKPVMVPEVDGGGRVSFGPLPPPQTRTPSQLPTTTTVESPLSDSTMVHKPVMVPEFDGGGRVSFGPLSQPQVGTPSHLPTTTTVESPLSGERVVRKMKMIQHDGRRVSFEPPWQPLSTTQDIEETSSLNNQPELVPDGSVVINISSVNPETEEIMKESDILTEVNHVMNQGIQTRKQHVDDNELHNEIKEAIPVERQIPQDIDKDIEQDIEDLKTYAQALSDGSKIAHVKHDKVARKLAGSILDDLRIRDEQKEELLGKLLKFVTSVEIDTIRERVKEVQRQIIRYATEVSDDKARVYDEATRLLHEFIDQLPLSRHERKVKHRELGKSELLNNVVHTGQDGILKEKLKQALVTLVTQNLL